MAGSSFLNRRVPLLSDALSLFVEKEFFDYLSNFY